MENYFFVQKYDKFLSEYGEIIMWLNTVEYNLVMLVKQKAKNDEYYKEHIDQILKNKKTLYDKIEFVSWFVDIEDGTLIENLKKLSKDAELIYKYVFDESINRDDVLFGSKFFYEERLNEIKEICERIKKEKDNGKGLKVQKINKKDLKGCLEYEWKMLNHSYFLIKTSPPFSFDQKVAIESFLIHVRNIYEFLYCDKKYDNDINFLCFSKTKTTIKLPKENNKNKINKFLAHITTERLKETPSWQVDLIFIELNTKLKEFLDNKCKGPFDDN